MLTVHNLLMLTLLRCGCLAQQRGLFISQDTATSHYIEMNRHPTHVDSFHVLRPMYAMLMTQQSFGNSIYMKLLV